MAFSKKHLLRYCVLATLALVAAPQPARADGMDVAAIMSTWGSQAAMWIQQQTQNGFGFSSISAGQAAQVQAANNNTDTIGQHIYRSVDATSAVKIGTDNMLDPDHSACAIAKASLAKMEIRAQTGSVAAAMSNSPALATPTASITDMKAAYANGLKPCTYSSDPEYSSNIANGCTSVWGGKWERADKNPNIFSAYLSMPVPPEFKIVNGVYQPITTKVSSEKYMPFVAALSFCQSLPPRLPAPPQGGGAGKVTQATLGQGDYDSGERLAGMSKSKCLATLSKHMSYEANIAGFAANHDSQAAACDADAKRKWTDGDPQISLADGSSGACQTYGRSKLQMEYDEAHRDSSTTYQTVYLKSLSRDQLAAEERDLPHIQSEIDNKIDGEADSMANAMKASADANPRESSRLEAPVGN